MFIDSHHSEQQPNLSQVKKASIEKRLQGRNASNFRGDKNPVDGDIETAVRYGKLLLGGQAVN
ncbi:hypothetical protein [Methylicorpusculum sp.]|uniref:hypothetical protein n=1 Tax=Methylicorpusculum sp. TaxID=2713644 RepID=UPI00273162FB|nr:hypothetical protein [Methylicorpusculum sp.]MDP2178899.1 hypothetical protein [Methylicorpusculum sp.]MDP3530284.1 hypothetical protein [Methylicorpusculum sp.]MDZ4151265.1 hypothetical protein [Methylicorpusculum sp.]